MKNRFGSDFFRVIIMCVLFLGFFLTTTIYSYRTKDYKEFAFDDGNGVVISFDDDWIDEDGNTVNLDELSYDDYKEKGSYIFYKVLPSNLTGEESLCLRVRHMGFALYFDDREYDGYEHGETPDNLDFVVETVDSFGGSDEFDEIISSHYDEYISKYGIDYIAFSVSGEGSGIGSKGAGTYLYTMQLYGSDSGDTIYLELFPVYKSSAISDVRIEPSNAYIRYMILSTLPGFMICMFVIITGFVVVIMTKFVNEKTSSKIFESLSALIIIIGLWSLIETHLFDYILGTSEYLHTLEYFLIASIAYPAAMFSDAVTLKPHKNIAGFIFYLSVAIIIFCTFSNYLGYYDFHKTVILPDILIIVVAIFIIIRILADQKFRKDNDLHVNTHWIDISLAILTILGLVDVLRYIGIISVNRLLDSSSFTRLGILIFTIGMLINIYEEVLHRNKQADKAGTYMEMAFTDALTGIPNRGAFLIKENELSEMMKDGFKKRRNKHFQIVYVSLDLNGLKAVNDTLGHAMGDKYIINCSNILMQAFGDCGYVYRVGGDEFASFLDGENAIISYEKCIGRMLELLNEYNTDSDLDMKMQIAYGYSLWTMGDSRDISQVEKDGDEAMYEKKRQMKSELLKKEGN